MLTSRNVDEIIFLILALLLAVLEMQYFSSEGVHVCEATFKQLGKG